MSALTINGVTVPVALDGWEEPDDALFGAVARAPTGRAESSVRARRWRGRARTAPLSRAEAHALRGLVSGRGRAWPFDTATGLYSGCGAGVGSGGGTIVTTFPGKHGQSVLPGAMGLAYSVPFSDEWTAMGWQVDPTAEWHHRVLTSTGVKYKDGVTTEEAPGFGVSGDTLGLEPGYDTAGLTGWEPEHEYFPGDQVAEGGEVFTTFANYTSGTEDDEPDWGSVVGFPFAEVEEDPGGTYGGPFLWVNTPTVMVDDLVYLPYLVPPSWPPMLFEECSARPWTPQPRVRVAGDLAGRARVGTGRLASATPLLHRSAGVLERLGQVVAFELTERVG